MFRYLLIIISVILLIISYPPFDLSILIWIGLIPLFYYILGAENKREAFRIGLGTGALFFFGCQYWIYHSINAYGDISFITSILVVLLLSSYEGLYIGIFAASVNLVYRRDKLPITLFGPALWVCLEFIRGILFSGFPWTLIGHSLYKFHTFIQICDITGVYGLSFIIIFFNMAIAEYVLNRKGGRKNIRRLIINLTIFFIIVSSIILYGRKRIEYLSGQSGGTITISVIQPSIDQGEKWRVEYSDEILKTLEGLSQKALNYKPDLIVWPESSFPFGFGSDKKNTQKVFDIEDRLKTSLLFGSFLIRGINGDNINLTNSAVLLLPDKKIAYVYDKIHLVPFGEYVPLSDILFFLDRLVPAIGTFKPGRNLTIATTRSGNFATLICYEIIFPDLVRRFCQYNNVDFLVTITNDGWFGKTSGPYQHFAIALFRAIENRKPLIRAANTGISGFIDNTGRILDKTLLYDKTSLTKKITISKVFSFYTEYGDVFVYLCIIITVTSLYFLRKNKENY